MTTTNGTNLRRNLFSYLDAAAVNDEKVFVTTKNGTAVIISEEYLNNLEETCYLYSIPGMKASILEAYEEPLEECKKIDWKKLL